MNTVLENTLLQDYDVIILEATVFLGVPSQQNHCQQAWCAMSHLQNKHLKQLLTNQITHPARKSSINMATIDTVSVAEGH